MIYNLKQIFDEDSEKVKFSRKVSDGQITKKLADISKLKVYGKKGALEVINDVIGGIDFGNGDVILQKTYVANFFLQANNLPTVYSAKHTYSKTIIRR